MAVTVDWGDKIIAIPQTDLVLVSGTLYELDTDWLRLELKALEDSVEGMVFPDTHRHNAGVVISGVEYAQTFEIINGYIISFVPDAHYTVRLFGSNNNIPDVLGVAHQHVSLIAQNSGGLIVTSSGGVTPAQVWAKEIETGFTAEELLRVMAAALAGKLSGAATTEVTIRDVTDSKDRIIATVDADGNRTDVVLDPA